MRIFVAMVTALCLFCSLSANAAVIEISYPEQDIVRAALSGIEAVDDRVYTIRLNDDGTAEVQFGDGVQGGRPSSGGNVVASYRFGAGIEGKIVNEYEIVENRFPIIPIDDFWPPGTNQPDVSFVIVGLSSITFDFSPAGLKVIDAKPASALVPAPPPLLLLLIGMAGLGFVKRHRSRVFSKSNGL